MAERVPDVINRVHEIFRNRGLTLSVAESCTGGLISHYLTGLPGASTFFAGGIVSYSAEVKKRILGVSGDTIRNHGVVSEEAAREMAERMRLRAKTDYAISVTGNLGPDVLEGKDRGLVYIAVAAPGGTVSRRLTLKGDRQGNKEEASLSALGLLLELLVAGL